MSATSFIEHYYILLDSKTSHGSLRSHVRETATTSFVDLLYL